MGYVSPYSDLGAVVTMMDGGDAGVARMQSAINRVLLNARNDQTLQGFLRDAARASAAPIPVNGVGDVRTLAASKSAGLVAGATTIEITNAAFTEKLEAFADSRGYPSGDTVAERVFGLPIAIPGIKALGISGRTVAIAGGALLLATFLFLRRRA